MTHLLAAAWLAMGAMTPTDSDLLRVQQSGKASVLSLGRADAFHVTSAKVESPYAIRLPGSDTLVASWTERSGRSANAYFAISQDGASVDRVAEQQTTIETLYGSFDPSRAQAPVHPSLKAKSGAQTYFVQFVTQPLEEYRQEIRQAGGTIWTYFPHQAYVVRMDAAAKSLVKAMPFVRAVAAFDPGLKLSPELSSALVSGKLPTQRYYISVFKWGPDHKAAVALQIELLGGKVHPTEDPGYLMQATLDAAQLRAVLGMDEVCFVDPWSPPQDDMNVVRQVGGANFLQTTLGFTGQGVRGEVMDGNVLSTHADFQLNPILFHSSGSGSMTHGTPTTGIVFGTGTANPTGRGMLPAGQPIFAGYQTFGNRFTHTQQLLSSPYYACFQSNSWGSTLTTLYNSVSQEMDDILFRNDITIFQSQSNTGNQSSRPQAWAKNIISVGGVYHLGTESRTDDRWNGGASIGPASDGRIKPDLAFFYDQIYCPYSTNSTSYTSTFGGTSAATPMTAGYAGLFFQMWHNGIFGNPATGATVFDNRPKAPLVKAMLANRAYRYAFTGTTADLSRFKQGWGTADVTNIYNARNKMMLINERDALMNLQTKTYRVWVPAGEPEFVASMAYLDPPQVPNATIHRINDLSLKVTAPNGSVYWGNNGLTAGNVSTVGGSANTRDTLECVIVPSPQSGVWTVQVIASEINQDARLESPEVDADFALVVTGVQYSMAPENVVQYAGSTQSGSASDLPTSNNSYWRMRGGSEFNDMTPVAAVRFENTVPGGSLSELRIRVEARTPQSGVTGALHLFGGQNDSIRSFPLGAVGSSDAQVEVVVTTDLAQLIHADGKIRGIVVWRRASSFFDVFVDQVRFEMQP